MRCKKRILSLPPPAPKGNQRAKGHGFGRPKIYDDAFIEAEAEAFLAWIRNPENIWMEDFAVERGYSPQRLYEFAKTNPVFSEVLEYVKHWQKGKLIKGGLLDTFNAGFTKFVMGNTCGWYDKQQISGDASNPLSVAMNKADGSSKDLVNGK